MKTFLKTAYQPYKWLVIVPFFFIITIITAVLVLTESLFRQKVNKKWTVFWSKSLLAVSFLKISITGRKNYDSNKSYVLIANHQSAMDIPAIQGSIDLELKWVVKKELGKIPLFGAACDKSGHIYIDRSNKEAAINSIRESAKKMSEKDSVMFFPEGTRSKDGKVKHFKKGAFKFAMEKGLPILPMTVRNSSKIMPARTLDLSPGTIEIIIHPPVRLNAKDSGDLDRIIENIRQVISAALCPKY